MQENPVYIAGADRSGTSLLFALLASHPNISMVRRTNMWRYFYGQFGDLGQSQNFERCLTAMLQYKRLEHLDPDPERIRREFWQWEPTYGRLFALFHEHHAERQGKSRWGDKSLHTEHYTNQVFKEYPQAKIIHMIRDPRDRYASILKRHKTDSRRIISATARWMYSMRNADRYQKRYPARYMVLRYETLAQFPEDSLRDICTFIGEPYLPEMLTMKGSSTHMQAGNSSFGDIEPGVISTKAINRFRQVLNVDEWWFIQLSSGKTMKAYDYQLEPVHLSLSERMRFLFFDFPVKRARVAGWMARETIMVNRGEKIPENRLARPNGVTVQETV
jgi:hypothetical protein